MDFCPQNMTTSLFKKVSVFSCVKVTFTNPDWYLLDAKDIIHILGENKNTWSAVIPEPQLTTKVIT